MQHFLRSQRGRKRTAQETQWRAVHDGRFRAPLQLARDGHSMGFSLILLAASPKGTHTLTEQEYFGIPAVFPGGPGHSARG
jgi:hypothetical protein